MDDMDKRVQLGLLIIRIFPDFSSKRVQAFIRGAISLEDIVNDLLIHVSERIVVSRGRYYYYCDSRHKNKRQES